MAGSIISNIFARTILTNVIICIISSAIHSDNDMKHINISSEEILQYKLLHTVNSLLHKKKKERRSVHLMKCEELPHS